MTTRADQIDATSTVTVLNDSTSKIHDIFEGTEQILTAGDLPGDLGIANRVVLAGILWRLRAVRSQR
ncbi:MAG: hypothetical protein GY798_25420 [Hyphomicrobiales bacterium]|nr:hypothetical protein [Hyphomicrobiales bacterium]